MSFVDLMGNDVWSQADIDNRVQNIIRGKYSAEDELKAARLARKATPSSDEAAFLADVDATIVSALNEGRQAANNMALLSEVLSMEVATQRLAQPEVEPEFDEEGNVTNQEALDRDQEEWEAAQAVLENASAEAKELYDLRNPVVVEEVVETVEA